MHSHLAIIGANGELALKPDTSLNVTDKNPMFNDVEMFTQTIPLSFDLNRRVLKNMDDVNSTMRSGDVQGERFQFVLDGIPFRNTAIKIQDGTKLDGTIDVNFDATNRTFKDMIADLRCRDVTVDDDILIGQKVGHVKWHCKYEYYYKIYGYWGYQGEYHWDFADDNQVTREEVFEPMATGFSYPAHVYQDANCKAIPRTGAALQTRTYPNPNKDETGDIVVNIPDIVTSYINTSIPYGMADQGGKRWPYCNSRICYAHHDVKDGETSSEIVPSTKAKYDGVDYSPYWVLDANRSASGICFYVAYFLECLFKNLGVAYDMTALTNIEDFNYLCFFSTGCHYDVKEITWFNSSLNSKEQINDWLESRGCGGRIDVNDTETTIKKPDEITYTKNGEEYTIVKGEEYNTDMGLWGGEGYLGEILDIEARTDIVSQSVTAKVLEMYANSDNFPDVNVTEVIESLENSFGVRFVYDAENNKVTVRLLRDMFRDQQDPIPFKGTVLKMVKMAENIRGIRMKYSAESDAQEQRDNIRYNKRDYDTTYDYVDYQQGRTEFASYLDATKKIDVGNKTCYVDMATGDAFRIKVNSDASTVDELKPVMFEVAGLHGVELGDCSEDAERDDAIKEFVSRFEPILTNDVAFGGRDLAGSDYQPMLVPFFDEDMEHEFLRKTINNPISTLWADLYLSYKLCLVENYDPSSTDDGESPLQTHDWGLTVGILRPGAGADTIVNYDANYDGFGNEKWYIKSGGFAIVADSYDVTGRFLGTSPAGSFSLKPRAYKPFRYKYDGSTLLISTDPKQWEDDPTWLIPCIEDERDPHTGMITKRIRSRGMCDTWMIEFFRFLLERQKYYIEALCTAAELADIPNKWLRRWEIDGKIGWINILTYPIDVQTGLGKVGMEFFAM